MDIQKKGSLMVWKEVVRCADDDPVTRNLRMKGTKLRNNQEMDEDIVQLIKSQRTHRLGHLERMVDQRISHKNPKAQL